MFLDDTLIKSISVDCIDTNTEMDSIVSDIMCKQIQSFISRKFGIPNQCINIDIKNISPMMYCPRACINYNEYYHSRRDSDYEHIVTVSIEVPEDYKNNSHNLEEYMDSPSYKATMALVMFTDLLNAYGKLVYTIYDFTYKSKDNNRGEALVTLKFPPNNNDWTSFCKYISKEKMGMIKESIKTEEGNG